MSEVVKHQIPEAWEWTTLGDVFKWGSGGTPKSTNPKYYGGNIPWLIIRDLNDAPVSDSETKITEDGLRNSSAKWVEPGSVLVAMYGSIGKLGLATERLTTNQAIAFTQPDPNDAKYLFYYLMFSRSKLHKQGKGIAQKNISQTVLKAFPFPLAPLEQQKRIVAKIEELFSHIDAGIEALNKAKKLLKQYRQSVLKAAVTGEITKEWREQNKDKLEPASQLLERILTERRQKWEEQQLEQFKAKGKMPKDDKWKEKYKKPELLEEDFPVCDGWVAATISQVAECLDNIRKPINKKERAERVGDIPYYGANGPVGFIDDYLFDEPLVLVVEDETFVGRTLPFTYKIEGKTWVNNHAHVLRATEVVLTDYLNYSLMYYPFTPLTTGSTGRRKLTQKALNKAPYPLPSIAEQKEMVSLIEEKLNGVERMLSEIEVMFLKAEKNKQSILASAFSGKLL